jgi:hypothetical protein
MYNKKGGHGGYEYGMDKKIKTVGRYKQIYLHIY